MWHISPHCCRDREWAPKTDFTHFWNINAHRCIHFVIFIKYLAFVGVGFHSRGSGVTGFYIGVHFPQIFNITQMQTHFTGARMVQT